MRRTIILALMLLVSVVAGAQMYPPELAGSQTTGVYELKFVTTDVFNVPWSMPDPPYDSAWVTNIGIGILPPFPALVEVECLISLTTGECIAGPPGLPIQEFPWNENIAAYAITNTDPTTGDQTIDVYSWQAHTWYHYVGFVAFTGSPPQWYDWGWYVLDISESQVPKIPNQPASMATE